ncbi:MAG: glycosyltransferase [Chitinophagaceae bacterium]|nr:MAG: glycosyltransferase [Chitinophagaceae bacterium]
MASYFILASISARTMSHYLKENSFVDYDVILSSDIAPRISIIAPAFNESLTVVDSVRSLLTLQYNHFEVVVVNDGSTDDTFQLLQEAYQLKRIEYKIDKVFETEPILSAYRSTNTAYNKLLVVNKENGRKADAANVGIMFAANPYILVVDVDGILSKDALQILAKPFLEKSEDRRVIATGGVLRIANSCVVRGGRIVEVNPPDGFLPRMQTIEYLRAFLLGRMAWFKLDGLLIISGAFGLFEKEIAIKAGGYNRKTVGEDMEIVVRMRRYMLEQKQKYQVTFLPNPLCWTLAPETFKALGNQRRRWTRGTMETLWLHRKMFFRPRYKLLGMLSMPYWGFLEYLSPLIEFLGILITISLLVLGLLNLKFVLLFLLFAYSFAVLYSVITLLTEEYTYHLYKKNSDFRKLLFVAFIDPIYFHLFIVYSAIRGNIEKIRGYSSWGVMEKKGFTRAS